MTRDELDRLRRQLRSRLPLLGKGIRRTACQRLAADGSAAAVPLLVEALGVGDQEVQSIADGALRSLEDQGAVDAMCAQWVGGRDPWLRTLVTECGYVASQPPEVRVLSALQADQLHCACEGPGSLPSLVSALDERDQVLAGRAHVALSTLTAPDAIDTLCEMAIASPSGRAARVVNRYDYQPTAVGRRCILFLLTGQIERYLDLDFEFQHLRAEYGAADETLQRRIRETVRRSGDTRLLGLFRGGSIHKRADELTETEAAVALEVYARQSRWAEICSLLFHIPMCSVVAAVGALGKSGWRPESADAAALLDDLIATVPAVGEVPPPPPAPEVVLGPVMGRWIDRGQSPEFSGQTPQALHEQLAGGSPPDAVAALTSLAARGETTPEDVEAARTHRHWLVRLACLALCDIAPQLAFSDAPVRRDGGEMWIEQLAPSLLDAAVWRQRASDLSPEQAAALGDAVAGASEPQSARLAVGRMMRALGAFHLRHVIEVEEQMVVHIDETDIEIEG